jgi:hypothetical protein
MCQIQDGWWPHLVSVFRGQVSLGRFWLTGFVVQSRISR